MNMVMNLMEANCLCKYMLLFHVKMKSCLDCAVETPRTGHCCALWHIVLVLYRYILVYQQ